MVYSLSLSLFLLSRIRLKKFLAAGVPREKMRPENERSSRNPGGARAATIGFPIGSAHLPSGPSTGPYGGKAYINSALTALRRSFVPICSTRLAHSCEGEGKGAVRRWGRGGRGRRTKGVEGRLSSPPLSVSLFHCHFPLPLRLDLCPALRRPIKSPFLRFLLFFSPRVPTRLSQPRFASS